MQASRGSPSPSPWGYRPPPQWPQMWMPQHRGAVPQVSHPIRPFHVHMSCIYRFGATLPFVPSSPTLGSNLAGQLVPGRSLGSPASQVLIIQSSRSTTGPQQPTWHLAFLSIPGKVLCPRLLRRAGRQAREPLLKVAQVLNTQRVLQSQAGSTFPLQGQRGRQAPHHSILSTPQLKQPTPHFNTHLALKCWTKGLQPSLKTFPVRG